MMWLYVVLFFLLIGLIVFFTIKYLEADDLQRFADELAEKKKNEYRKPKQEDITDL